MNLNIKFCWQLIWNLQIRIQRKQRKKINSVCNFIGLTNSKLNYECKKCKKKSLKPINEFKRVFNKYINKFAFLLKKVFYPYQYTDSWKTFNVTSLPDKKAFYSQLQLDDITGKDYTNAQKLFEKFNLKSLSDQSDT